MTRRLFLAMALASAAAGVTLGSASASISGAPTRRIVSLVPAATEMIFAMGAGADVIGVSSYDHYPPEVETRAKVGALIDPDFERILSLRPDLVIVFATQRDLIERLQRANIPMFTCGGPSLADILATIRALGARIDHAADAERVAAGIERQLDDVRAKVAGQPRPRTLLVFGRDAESLRGLFVSGGIGFLHDMLEAAGGDDVFSDMKRENVEPSTETILARHPDVVLELRSGPGWTRERIMSERAVWRTLPSLPAVQHDRIYILSDDFLSIPGPRVGLAAKVIAETLHPDAFRTGGAWRPY